jgi:hypothetical protein
MNEDERKREKFPGKRDIFSDTRRLGERREKSGRS